MCRLEEVTEKSKRKKQEAEKKLIPVLERVKTFFEQACQKANEHNQAVNKLLEGMFETFSALNMYMHKFDSGEAHSIHE